MRRERLKARARTESNPAVPVGRILFVDGTKLGRSILDAREDGPGNGENLLLGVPRVVKKGGRPRVPPDSLAGDENRAGGELARKVVQEAVALQGAVQDEAGELNDPLIGMSCLQVPHEEAMGAGDGDLVVKSLEDPLLRLQDLVSGVGPIADVDKIPELGRVDLLVLGGDQKAGNTDELELGTLDLLDRKVPVDEVDGEVQRLRHQLELEVNLDQPIDEDGTHALVDVGLVLHVGGAGQGELLLVTEVIVLTIEGGARLVRWAEEKRDENAYYYG